MRSGVIIALGMVVLGGRQENVRYTPGPSSLRAPAHLLDPLVASPGRVASANARFGCPVPRKLHSDTAALTRGELQERCTPGSREQLPGRCDSGSASVATAGASWGCTALLTSKPTPRLPVLAFPQPGLDDTTAYQGYQTRFYRDSKDNTVQIYIQPQSARVVLVWADAANESAGFTVRDAAGRPARLSWGIDPAEVSDSAATRTIEYSLVSDVSRLEIGWLLLGSMRVERDFVYARRHLAPFTAPPYRVAEESLLVADLGRLSAEEQKADLDLLGASSLQELRGRLQPTISTSVSDSIALVRVYHPSLDGQRSMSLELRVDPRRTRIRTKGRTVVIETRPGSQVKFRIRVTTDAPALTPLSRTQIFTPPFLQFVQTAETDSSPEALTKSRRIERQIRAVELLSSEEKLMAGLPNFATYFGRDMMMTALMMAPIWSPEMLEHVIASVLRKLGPHGDVSHEEALGGQAIRENAVVYDSLIQLYLRRSKGKPSRGGDSLVAQARGLLRNLQNTRENYHMLDDEFQLPVLSALYLADTTVSPDRKRAFLLEESEPGGTRIQLLLRELALVTTLTSPYVQNPTAKNLVSFPKRDPTHWRSASWRDSDAGYAGGRFAMDINVIWVPRALESIAGILRAFDRLGFTASVMDSVAPEFGGSALGTYARDSTRLQHAIDRWKGARQHFEVTFSPAQIRRHVQAKLTWLPAPERRYWQNVVTRAKEPNDSLTFLALSLDADGRAIPVANTDPSTELFLTDTLDERAILGDIAPFQRPFPVGLFVEGLGPLVANDAYASRAIWDRFQADQYHGPRVVWGREVNLLFLGLAKQITASDASARSVKDLMRRTLAAVNASGLQHNELWSYQIKGGKLVPVRYGTSSDVQLWNTTTLVVQYVLSKLPR
jgi:hypothetical protein